MQTRTLVLPVRYDADVLTARERGRAFAEEFGCTGSRLTLIATVISGAARKILAHSAPGAVVIELSHNSQKRTIDICLVIQVHSASGKIGVGESPDWKNIDGIEVIFNPEATVLKWTEHLVGEKSELDSRVQPQSLEDEEDDEMKFSGRDLRGAACRQIGDRPPTIRFFL